MLFEIFRLDTKRLYETQVVVCRICFIWYANYYRWYTCIRQIIHQHLMAKSHLVILLTSPDSKQWQYMLAFKYVFKNIRNTPRVQSSTTPIGPCIMVDGQADRQAGRQTPMYYDIRKHICMSKIETINNIVHYAKLIDQPSFKTRFPNCELTYRRQVVNLRVPNTAKLQSLEFLYTIS